MDPSHGIAILLDGEFAKKCLQRKLGKFPSASDIVACCEAMMARPELSQFVLHRIYYYTANPLQRGTATNPLDGTKTTFANTTQSKENSALLDSLEQKPNFAVRRGALAVRGWKLTTRAARRIERKQQTSIAASDLAPNIQQKGVDMRIGLDIAALALKRLVYAVLLVTGDTDMVPAMKFARREGLRVYLHTMGATGVYTELKIHADIVI